MLGHSKKKKKKKGYQIHFCHLQQDKIILLIQPLSIPIDLNKTWLSFKPELPENGQTETSERASNQIESTKSFALRHGVGTLLKISVFLQA